MTQKSATFKKKLTDHNHAKYITTPEFNTLAADVFNAKSNNKDTNLSIFNRKIASNKSKHLLVEDELKKAKNI